jgi:hypothetical protein
MANVQLAVAGDDTTQVILSVPGVQGPTGSSIPPSGTTNQILFKQSNTDYDTGWSFVTSAMIASGTIVNEDVNASAAIAGTKISPNFGSQNVVTTGTSTAASFIPTSSSVPTNGVYLPSANNVAISTNGTGRLFVDSSGRLGLGNSSPGGPLDVAFTNATVYSATTSANNALAAINSSATTGSFASVSLSSRNTANAGCTVNLLGISTSTNNASDFAIQQRTTSGAYRENLRITHDGKVGIGSNGAGGYDVLFNPGTSSSPLIRDSSGRLLVGTSSASTTSTTVFQGNSGGATSHAIANLQRGATNLGTNLSLGFVQFADSVGSVGAQVYAQTDAAWAAGSYPGRLVFSTTADGASSPTERMRIRNNGELWIHSSGGDPQFLITNSTGAGTSIRLISGRHSGGTIGTGTESFSVFTNGNVVNTNNSYGPLSSDERLKQDITDAGSQWDDIKAIRVAKFRYKNDPTGKLQLGPIAQELEQVSPGLVTRRFASEEEVADPSNDLVDGDEVLSFKASILYMKAVKALQEAMERIETLEAKVAALEAS